MARSYDDTISQHYEKVAADAGLSSSSTMADRIIRAQETEAIESFVGLTVGDGAARVADVGCGNGYTLGELNARYPGHHYVGIEYTEGLRKLAQERFNRADNVDVYEGDLRDPKFAAGATFDVLICQRVLINLLEPSDQRQALQNVIASVRPGGYLLFIEAFTTPLAELNEAREELELDPIEPAHHNLYLEDDFFEVDELEPFEHESWSFAPNHLSTHYFISRAFEPGLTRGRPFKRNSKVMTFFSSALPQAVGNFAPLQIHAFRRRG